MEAISQRVGIEIHDYTIPYGDGTLRGWRTVSGPAHLPFFIDYPNNGDRIGRLQVLYDRVGHTCSPIGFSELTIGRFRIAGRAASKGPRPPSGWACASI